MNAQILNHPAVILPELQNARLHWICQSVYYNRRGDRDNQSYCQGKASGLNDAIVALGGETISLRLEDYMVADEKPKLMQRSELAPCPFCGAQPHFKLGKLRHCQLHGEPMQAMIIYCGNQECHVRPEKATGDVHNGGEAKARIEAARKWAVRA